MKNISIVVHAPELSAPIVSPIASTQEEIVEKKTQQTSLIEPTPADIVSNFVQATSKWALAGFPITEKKTYEYRSSFCSSCELWDAKARFGLGKCNSKKCGCTSVKLWIATEKCPIGKW